MTTEEIRQWDKDYENNKTEGKVVAARALIEIAAQLSELTTIFRDLCASHDGRLMVSVKGWTE